MLARRVLLVLFSISLLLQAQAADLAPNTLDEANQVADAAKNFPDQYLSKPLLFVPMLEAPKELKGDLSAPVWEKAATFRLQAMVKGELVAPKFTTVAKMFCTSDALYLGVTCEDADPANATVSNPMAWQNDSVEFFFYPGESCRGGKLYYQIVVDAAKKVEFYHTHLYPKHNFQGRSDQWKPSGVEAEVKKADKHWSMELKVKYTDIGLPDEVKNKQTLWRMDLFRNRVDRGGIPAQSMAWAATDSTGSYHLCGRYGYFLPAALATPEFTAELARTAAANATDIAPGQEVTHEIADLIGRLGNDDYNTRNTATLSLDAMVEQKRPLARFIQTQLKKVLTDSDDSEVRLRSMRVLKTCYNALNPDDDTPPQLNAQIDDGL